MMSRSQIEAYEASLNEQVANPDLLPEDQLLIRGELIAIGRILNPKEKVLNEYEEWMPLYTPAITTPA